MKNFKVVSKCQFCNNDLYVKELCCGGCDTKIQGRFRLSKFDYLTDEQLYFVEVFLKNSGSIKGVEKDLNISYPTVKKHLDEIISAFGYKVSDETKPNEEPPLDDILEQIKAGVLTATEAIKKIKREK